MHCPLPVDWLEYLEGGSSGDLLLLRVDTDMSVPWLALLRHQTIADVRSLEACIGKLTEAGQAIVQDVLGGRAPIDRFGSSIEGANDARLEVPALAERVIS